jgi:hypothetical protein
MRLQIPLTEVQLFLNDQYNIDIELKSVEENKIEATYIDSVILNIKEVKEGMILIQYEADGLAHIVAKVAHFFLNKKLDNSPVEWDSKNEKVKVDLNKITELNGFLKFISVSGIHFKNDAIIMDMNVKSKA